MNKLEKLIGLTVEKVIIIPGSTHLTDREVILFTDGKTVMECEEQDPYTYHDMSYTAREIDIYENSVRWKLFMEQEE